MNTFDEFRANAAECQRMSDATIDVTEKAIWRELAAHWLYRSPTPIKPLGTAK